MNALLLILMGQLCCTILPDNTFMCRDAKLADGDYCEWTISCEDTEEDMFPVCGGTEVLLGAELRCCDDTAAIEGLDLEGCSMPGTAFGIVPWCHDPVRPAMVTCRSGWQQQAANKWSCVD